MEKPAAAGVKFKKKADHDNSTLYIIKRFDFLFDLTWEFSFENRHQCRNTTQTLES